MVTSGRQVLNSTNTPLVSRAARDGAGHVRMRRRKSDETAILSLFDLHSLPAYIFFPSCGSSCRRRLKDFLVYGAVRIVHGQVFARDFFEVVGPGPFYWLALFFKLFVITLAATRICLFFTSLGTGLAMYFLSRRVCGRYRVLPCIYWPAHTSEPCGRRSATTWIVIASHCCRSVRDRLGRVNEGMA